MADVTYPAAALAGLISFISPCVLPLVPPYLCLMTGVSIEGLKRGAVAGGPDGAVIAPARFRTALPALFFVIGFSVVFISLGAGASVIGQLLRAHLDLLGKIAGVAILLMGLNFLGILKLGWLFREARFTAGGAGLAGSFIMGLAFAFGWTPCIGPILGVILAVAGSKGSVAEGAALLAAYSAGLGLPFLAAALFAEPFMNFLARFRHHLGTVEKAMGAMLVVTAILFFTGGMQTMSFWLLEKFPALGLIG